MGLGFADSQPCSTSPPRKGWQIKILISPRRKLSSPDYRIHVRDERHSRADGARPVGDISGRSVDFRRRWRSHLRRSEL